MSRPGLLIRKISFFILIILLCAYPLFAAPAINTDNFAYFGDVLPGPIEPTGFFVLEVAPEAYATMDPAWRDLRIYNNSGQEIGFMPLLSKYPSAQTQYQDCVIINKGPINDTDKYSFTIVDLPSDAGKLTVRLDKPEYLVKSEIYGSNDSQTWQLVGTQTLYGINENYNVFSLRNISYRYLKFEFAMPPGDKLSVSSVQYGKQHAAKKTDVSFPIVQSEKDKSTIIMLDLGYNNYTSRGLQITTDDKNFYRRATLEASNNQDQWQYVSSFYFYRGTDLQDENLRVEYPLTQARYLKITLYNSDNPPVIFTAATIATETVRLLVKDSPTNAPFKAYWGNLRLSAPLYDVNEIVRQSKVDPAVLPILHLDKYTENPQYQKPIPPLSERYPLLLPLVLILVVLVMGVIQYKSLNKLKD